MKEFGMLHGVCNNLALPKWLVRWLMKSRGAKKGQSEVYIPNLILGCNQYFLLKWS